MHCGDMNGKQVLKGGDGCMCRADSLCCTVETNTREGNGTPLQYLCLENPMDRGAWRAAVHGVVKSRA